MPDLDARLTDALRTAAARNPKARRSLADVRRRAARRRRKGTARTLAAAAISSTAVAAVVVSVRSGTRVSTSHDVTSINATSAVPTTAVGVLGFRPVITLNGCAPVDATQGTRALLLGFSVPADGKPDSPGAKNVQVFGDVGQRLAAPFVVVERSAPSTSDVTALAPNTTINGRPASISPVVDGKGGADWRLADGSYVVVRSRGLTTAQFEEFLSALAPITSGNGQAAGFTLAKPVLSELAYADAPSVAGMASSGCNVNGRYLSVSAIEGDLIAQASFLASAPSPGVAKVDGSTNTLIFVSGIPSTDALLSAALDSVRNASLQQWTQLINNSQQPASNPTMTAPPTSVPAETTSPDESTAGNKSSTP